MGRTSTTAEPQKRDAGTKLAQQRLSVLELAKDWGTSPRPVGSAAWIGPVSTSGSGGSRRRASRG